MTTETDLLPLPEGYDKYDPPLLYEGQMFNERQMQGYARANVAHATATLQAEVEALRAEVERLREALDDIRSRSVTDLVMRSDPAVQGEPVAYIRQEDFEFILADDKSEPYGTRQAPVFSRKDCRDPVPLYASPQPPAQHSGRTCIWLKDSSNDTRDR